MYEIGMKSPFSKQYRYVTNHLHLYLAISTFLCTQLPSYCLLCALLLSMPISLETEHLQLL